MHWLVGTYAVQNQRIISLTPRPKKTTARVSSVHSGLINRPWPVQSTCNTVSVFCSLPTRYGVGSVLSRGNSHETAASLINCNPPFPRRGSVWTALNVIATHTSRDENQHEEITVSKANNESKPKTSKQPTCLG